MASAINAVISIKALLSADTTTVVELATGVAPATVTATVELFDSLPLSSSTVYGTVAVPSKSELGTKLTSPSALTDHTPSAVVSELWFPEVLGTRSIVDRSILLFASVMLSDKSIVAELPAATTALSDVVTGATPAIVTETLAGADSLPSSSSTVKGIIASPSKPETGSKLTTPSASTFHTPSAVVKVFWFPGVP